MEALLRDPTQVMLRPEEQLLLQTLDKYFSIFFANGQKTKTQLSKIFAGEIGNLIFLRKKNYSKIFATRCKLG